MNEEMSYYDYLKKQVNDGFISENGTPLKCFCGCNSFKRIKEYYGAFGIEEYSLQCEKCKKIVGHWAYGNWQL